MSAPLEIEPAAGFDDLREDWQRLAAAAGSPFSTWEWATTWWRHYGDERPLQLFRCRADDGRTVAILPLYVARRTPVRTLRFVGQGPADQLAPICVPEDAPAAADALLRAVAARPGGARVLLADRLPGEGGWVERIGGRLVSSVASPVLDAGGVSFDEWLRSRSKNFREQVRRRERKLGKAYELSYRLTDDPDRLEADLDTLIRLHRERWGAVSRSFEGTREAFQRDFTRAALEKGWLRLWTLELDGRPAAAWLGYRFGVAEWYYQAGRDPALEREAVGFVLMAHTIRSALDDGMREYRLLLGGESYKDRFANRDDGLHTVVVGQGATGRAVAAAAGVAASTPELRRRLRRLAR